MKYLPFFKEYLNTFNLLDAADHLPLLSALCDFAVNETLPQNLSPRVLAAFNILAFPVKKSIDLRSVRSKAGKVGGTNGKGDTKARFGNKNASKTQAKQKQTQAKIEDRSMRAEERTKGKPSVSDKNISSCRNTPPPPQAPNAHIRTHESTQSATRGGGGGGATSTPASLFSARCARPISTPPVPPFPKSFDELLAHIPEDDRILADASDLGAAFFKAQSNGWKTSTGEPIRNWPSFFTQIARKSSFRQFQAVENA